MPLTTRARCDRNHDVSMSAAVHSPCSESPMNGSCAPMQASALVYRVGNATKRTLFAPPGACTTSHTRGRRVWLAAGLAIRVNMIALRSRPEWDSLKVAFAMRKESTCLHARTSAFLDIIRKAAEEKKCAARYLGQSTIWFRMLYTLYPRVFTDCYGTSGIVVSSLPLLHFFFHFVFVCWMYTRRSCSYKIRNSTKSGRRLPTAAAFVLLLVRAAWFPVVTKWFSILAALKY